MLWRDTLPGHTSDGVARLARRKVLRAAQPSAKAPGKTLAGSRKTEPKGKHRSSSSIGVNALWQARCGPRIAGPDTAAGGHPAADGRTRLWRAGDDVAWRTRPRSRASVMAVCPNHGPAFARPAADQHLQRRSDPVAVRAGPAARRAGSMRYLLLRNGGRRSEDRRRHVSRSRQVRGMAGRQGHDGRLNLLGQCTLKVRLEHVVLLADDVPGALRPPSSDGHLVCKILPLSHRQRRRGPARRWVAAGLHPHPLRWLRRQQRRRRWPRRPLHF